jgi:hypothetical protein
MKRWKFTSKWRTDLHCQSNDFRSTDSVSYWLVSVNETEGRGPAATNLIFPAEECLFKEVVGFKVGNSDRRRAFQEWTMKGFRTDQVSDFSHFNGCDLPNAKLIILVRMGSPIHEKLAENSPSGCDVLFASVLAHESIDTHHALRLANTGALSSVPLCDDGWRHPHTLITGIINEINAYLLFTDSYRRRGRF